MLANIVGDPMHGRMAKDGKEWPMGIFYSLDTPRFTPIDEANEGWNEEDLDDIEKLTVNVHKRLHRFRANVAKGNCVTAVADLEYEVCVPGDWPLWELMPHHPKPEPPRMGHPGSDLHYCLYGLFPFSSLLSVGPGSDL
jgi:hypothetical protein